MRLYKDFRFHILEDLSMDSILYVYRMFSTPDELEEINLQQIYEEAQRRRYIPIDSNLRLHVGEVFLVDNTGLKLVDKIENLLTEYLTGEYDWEIVSKIQQQLRKLIAEGVITDLINEEVLNMKVDQSEYDAHVVLADKEFAELRALVDQANSNATGAFLNANSLQTTVMGFSQSIHDLTQFHWDTVGNIEQVETRFGLAIDDQNRQIVAINDTTSLMRTEMDTYVEDLVDLGRELTGVTDATIRLSGDFSALAGRVTTTETAISTQGSKLTSTAELLESSIYDYNTKITSVDAELTSTKAGMEDAVARISATETVVDNHSTLIAQYDDRINLAVQSIEGVVETVETEIEGLRGDMASIQQTAEYIDVVLDNIVEVSDDTRALVDTQVIRIDELKDDLTDVTVRTDTIESDITSMNAEITIAKNAITSAVSDYTTQISGMETTITGISDDLGAVEATLGVHTTEISELDSKIVQETGRITSAVSDYNNKFTTVNTNIATEKGRIDTLNTSLNTEKGRINTLNTNLGTVTTDVTAAKAAIADYGTRIEATEGEIVDLDSRITQEADRITSAVTEYRNNYSTLSGDLDDLGVRLTTTEEDIVDLGSMIEQTATNITSSVSAVSSRVDTVSATANTAKTTAESAVSTANTASTTATTAKNTADTAKSTADTAKTDAATAKTTATGAVTTANTANTNATTALGTANTAKTTADSANSKIDNLKLGGRNLLEQSDFKGLDKAYYSKWTQQSLNLMYEPDAVPLHRRFARIEQTGTGVTRTVAQDVLPKIKPSTEYVLSFWYRTNFQTLGTTNPYLAMYGDGNYTVPGTTEKVWYSLYSQSLPRDTEGKWVKGYVKFNTNVSGQYFSTALTATIHVYSRDMVGTFDFHSLKLEEGNLSTDWSPAPEDVDEAIAAVETKIVTEVTALNSKIDQTATNITSTVSQLNTKVTTVESAAATASTNASTAVSTANTAKSTADTAKSTADTAKTDAATAKTNASNAVTTATTANTTATTAKSTADTAKSTADTAKTTADQAKTAASTADGKAVAAQNTANTANTAATNANSKIDNLKLGGRNLLRNSGTPVTNTSYPTKTYDITTPMVHDDYYTVTLKGSLGAGKTQWGVYNSGGMISLISLSSHVNGIYTGTFLWKNVSGTNTANDKTLHIYPMQNSVTGVNSTIEWIKLEKGNRATDWTPAPEDVDSQIAIEVTNLTSKIDQTAEAIEATVSNVQTNVTNNLETIKSVESLLKQTAEGLKAEVKARETIEETVESKVASAISLATTSLSVEFSSLAERIGKDEEATKTLISYFKFDAEGMIIGKSNSPVSIKITNSKIQFLENGEEVAYISGSMLYISRSTVLNSIAMANHVIEKSDFTTGRTLFRRV